MANLVITIGRENGSGGRQLGSELAAALGVKCYDSELINETAKASGFAKRLEMLDSSAPDPLTMNFHTIRIWRT